MSDSNDASLECPFERACSQKLGILPIPAHSHLWDFFSAVSSSSSQSCWFIHIDPSLNPFSSLNICFQNFQWWLFHLRLSFPSLLFCNTSMHFFFSKSYSGAKILFLCHISLLFELSVTSFV